ncbi:metallophosphoesterase [Paenibacillus puerhi]|uniref:metallophosphoesterase n=1 Tax=Paenibacillus puerhi TaxID=2692622 RepID=UPI001F48AAC2|nr:metallophosphoesterase [Paenibacillus puerhi]
MILIPLTPIAAAGLILLAIAALVYALLILPTQWLKLERIRFDAGLGIKALQLSDLHVERLRIAPDKIKRILEREKPDYIFITGDFTKLPEQLPRLGRYLAVLRESAVPVYAVLGNHDYQQPKVRRLIRFIEQYGIRLLRNESVVLPNFQLVGIDDLSSGKSNPALAFSKVLEDKPVIVITHDPNVVLKLRRPFGYLMAGHLHGRQLIVPLFFQFRPMGPLPAMGIFKGLHTTVNGVYYISKGMGQTAFNARFLVRSEVTIHEL